MQNCTRGMVAACWGLKCTYVQTIDRHMTYGKERSMVEWAWKISLHEISSIFFKYQPYLASFDIILYWILASHSDAKNEISKLLLMALFKENWHQWGILKENFWYLWKNILKKLIPLLIYGNKTSFVTSDLVLAKQKQKWQHQFCKDVSFQVFQTFQENSV